MEFPASVDRLVAKGQYADALAVLESTRWSADQLANQITRLELEELIGRLTSARTLAERLLRGSRLTHGQRAACENVVGKVLLEDGKIEQALEHLQRAEALSAKAGNLKQLCWIQSKLLSVLAERSGPDAAAPLLAELRRNTTKLGDHHTSALAHMFVAEMEARQGHFATAYRHVMLGKELLVDMPHVWLEALAENILLALCVLQSRIEEAKNHSSLALQLSDRSGAAAARRSAAANTGNLFFLCGEFTAASEFFERALALLPSAGERNNAVLDALANVRLLQERLTDCDHLLERIDSTIVSDKDRTFYAHRYAELTRTRLLIRLGRISEAARNCDYLLHLARATGDRFLSGLALVTQSYVLQAEQRVEDGRGVLREAFDLAHSTSVEVLARFEGVLASTLAKSGEIASADAHVQRARRMCVVVPNVPCLTELNALFPCAETKWPAGRDDSINQADARNALHSLCIAILHVSRPELVACEFADALFVSKSVTAASVVECWPDESERELLRLGEDLAESATASRIPIGGTETRKVELRVEPAADCESEQTLRLIGLVAKKLNEMHVATSERERRATLWPVEELPGKHSNTVVSGHMRELMTYAQRVARTTVNVLITGPSGTGKEILARAIHDFSDRALKPFVPFNCAAVPRELLESQLFGHRRGAFTGAERDQLGLIRSAADGTLFLDEVGELSLDLQPKLLRFLESGEIAPLGETSPFTVNVRVVAATNANLEDAVRDGKFREDLFYRLNVVRLSIKPLRERRDEIPGMVNHFVAAAAREYKKGHLQVAEDTMERLLLYRWPGNVRQLQNEVRRMVALAEPNSTLEPDAISADILCAMPQLHRTGLNGREIAISLHEKLVPTLSRIEYEMIKTALREHKGKVEIAAKSLGISRKGLYLKRQRLGL